jgi:hypothetical protein
MINEIAPHRRQEKSVADDRNPATNTSSLVRRAACSLLFLRSTRHAPGTAPSSLHRMQADRHCCIWSVIGGYR